MKLLSSFFLVGISSTFGFKLLVPNSRDRFFIKSDHFADSIASTKLSLSINEETISGFSFLSADTSISEEDVINVTGQMNDLPSPEYAIIFALVIFTGVAILQFSLGDLTREEGQARVRDFLQTKRDTERKRGYFD